MPASPVYSWMISFSDLEDTLVVKRGDAYIKNNPKPQPNYYDLTAAKFINFANSFNIDVSVLSGQVNDPFGIAPNHTHYLVRQWLIVCLEQMVCENNYGLNNVDNGIQDDVYFIKSRELGKKLMAIQGNIKYETIINGMLQQNFTRAGGTFRIQGL